MLYPLSYEGGRPSLLLTGGGPRIPGSRMRVYLHDANN
jgi:hypothetical protein